MSNITFFDPQVEALVPEEVKENLLKIYETSAFHSFGWGLSIHKSSGKLLVSLNPDKGLVLDSETRICDYFGFYVQRDGERKPDVLFVHRSNTNPKRIGNQLKAFRNNYFSIQDKLNAYLNEHVVILGTES